MMLHLGQVNIGADGIEQNRGLTISSSLPYPPIGYRGISATATPFRRGSRSIHVDHRIWHEAAIQIRC